ncbi:PilZ domain-containing protein [Pseudodesulfovibrio sp. zrk46]|uniref:PilZ domain-containing protein n=1 Tax=Pseudodesulfovibrio sp. zrk46 TaxID=2725288 RepID=UPI0014491478|nr:PilZ domain-containing protein [Pseudodesulfovibrio sp. zrk46]QJB58218.1 PilZ domain-containing protein [Pseudodesulfovibrio sp. zrk46]
MVKNPFKISFGKKSEGDRQAYRAKIDGLHVKIDGRPAVYVAKDLSPSGVGIGCPIGKREGQSLTIHLFANGKMVASNLKARVVRAAPAFTGLTFFDLDRRQADTVHRIVLDEQKRQAEVRKGNKDTSDYTFNF